MAQDGEVDPLDAFMNALGAGGSGDVPTAQAGAGDGGLSLKQSILMRRSYKLGEAPASAPPATVSTPDDDVTMAGAGDAASAVGASGAGSGFAALGGAMSASSASDIVAHVAARVDWVGSAQDNTRDAAEPSMADKEAALMSLLQSDHAVFLGPPRRCCTG